MTSQEKEIKKIMFIRRIIAPKKQDEITGDYVLEPDGYESATIKDKSIWFICKNKGE